MLILVSGLDFGTIKKWFGDFENFDFSAIYGSRKVKICLFSTNFEIRSLKTGQRIKIFKAKHKEKSWLSWNLSDQRTAEYFDLNKCSGNQKLLQTPGIEKLEKREDCLKMINHQFKN